MAGRRAPLKDRLLRHTQKSESCWLWQGSTNEHGYGQIKDDGNRVLKAHRASWEVHRGPVVPGYFVLHRCDTRNCVNPEHLFLGNHQDNMTDMVMKGRSTKGVTRPGAGRMPPPPLTKLTLRDVADLKRMYATGLYTHRNLAKVFQVSSSNITRALNGRSFRAAAREEVASQGNLS